VVETIFSMPDPPDGLPTPTTVIEFCKQHGYNSSGAPFPSADAPTLWIKYGYRVSGEEAVTHIEIGKLVNNVPNTAVFIPKVFSAFVHDRVCYIVMEYIRGRDSTTSKGDLPKIAAAVQQLISIPSDRISPGLIKHHFFYDWVSTAPYPSVKHLQAQINRVPTLNSSYTSRASN
jgi:hypothetical protein